MTNKPKIPDKAEQEQSDREIVEEAKLRIEKAGEEVSRMCQPGEKWIMQIPARPDKDTDLVISDGLQAGLDVIAIAERSLEDRTCRTCDAVELCWIFDTIDTTMQFESNKKEKLNPDTFACNKWEKKK